MAKTSIERPILFSAPMVKAILAGKKTQTRRVMKPQPDALREYGGLLPEGHVLCPIGDNDAGLGMRDPLFFKCPYGAVGDRLWVREAFASMNGHTWYAADALPGRERVMACKPSIHMPRRHCRILLEITAARLERLQAITEKESIAEGFAGELTAKLDAVIAARIAADTPARMEFWALWESLNKSRGYGWETNPWVWVISFRRIPQELFPGAIASGTCRICGCTQNRACVGGCSCVDESKTLCSTCEAQLRRADWRSTAKGGALMNDLTLRDRFALEMMRAIASDIPHTLRDGEALVTPEQLADMSYEFADAMLARRAAGTTTSLSETEVSARVASVMEG